MDILSSMKANRLKLLSKINQTMSKFEKIEDEGKEIQCSEGDYIKYYDKHGNYIMSKTDHIEGEDEDDDDREINLDSDDTDDSESDDYEDDEETRAAFVSTCAAVKMRLKESLNNREIYTSEEDFICMSNEKPKIPVKNFVTRDDKCFRTHSEKPRPVQTLEKVKEREAKKRDEQKENTNFIQTQESIYAHNFAHKPKANLEGLKISGGDDTTAPTPTKKPFVVKIDRSTLTTPSKTPKPPDILAICRQFKPPEYSHEPSMTTPCKTAASLSTSFKTPTTKNTSPSKANQSPATYGGGHTETLPSGKKIFVVKMLTPTPNKKPRFDPIMDLLKNGPR